jgi:hypothetical protein
MDTGFLIRNDKPNVEECLSQSIPRNSDSARVS